MLNGIDVSAFQPSTITRDVAHDFAIVKATEGTTYVSRTCDAQVQASLERGALVGVYHFASPGDANAQADYFVSQIKGYVGRALLVLDWEAGAVAQGPAWALRWLDRVQHLTGVKPLIYMSTSVVAAHDWSAVRAADYGLWTAAYGSNPQRSGYVQVKAPSVPHWGTPAMHQYGSRGRLPGYVGDLDLDVFYGDRAAWERYAAPGSAPTAAPAPPAPTGTSPAPVYPLPAGSYFGPKSGPAQSVSGYYSHRDDLRAWQQRMSDRGWVITVDGLYGPNTETIARAFQSEKGLGVDGLVGPATWRAAWEQPVT